MTKVHTGLVAATLMGLGQVASGALVTESFEYAPGALAGANGGSGWGGAWSVNVPAGVTGSIQVTSGSVQFSDYATAGNKLTLDVTATTAFLTTSAVRPVGVAVNSGELWVSFLYQRADGLTATTSRTAEVRLNDGAINFGSQVKPASSTGIAVRHDGTTGGNFTTPGVNLHDDADPYLVISKFSGLGAVGGTATMWVFNAAAYDGIKAGGLLESELDAAALIKATDTATQAEEITIGELLEIVNATSAAPFAFHLDELRIGSTLTAVVPEPAGVLIALAGCGLMLGRGLGRHA